MAEWRLGKESERTSCREAAPPLGSLEHCNPRPERTSHLILPMAVAAPVPTTTPRPRPAVTTVPLNSMQVLSCTTALAASTGAVLLATLPLSPVRMDCGQQGAAGEAAGRQAGRASCGGRLWGVVALCASRQGTPVSHTALPFSRHPASHPARRPANRPATHLVDAQGGAEQLNNACICGHLAPHPNLHNVPRDQLCGRRGGKQGQGWQQEQAAWEGKCGRHGGEVKRMQQPSPKGKGRNTPALSHVPQRCANDPHAHLRRAAPPSAPPAARWLCRPRKP